MTVETLQLFVTGDNLFFVPSVWSFTSIVIFFKQHFYFCYLFQMCFKFFFIVQTSNIIMIKIIIYCSTGNRLTFELRLKNQTIEYSIACGITSNCVCIILSLLITDLFLYNDIVIITVTTYYFCLCIVRGSVVIRNVSSNSWCSGFPRATVPYAPVSIRLMVFYPFPRETSILLAAECPLVSTRENCKIISCRETI